MLTQLEARTNQGDLLEFPLGDSSNGYLVTDIQGLDPVPATLVSSGYAKMDGEQYHSSRRAARNIVIVAELRQEFVDVSTAALRKGLYQFFMPKSIVNLRFREDDGTEYEIAGRVESCSTVLFAQEPTVQISVKCFDPDFRDPTEIEFNSFTTDTLDTVEIVYDGTIETGFLFKLRVDRPESSFTIYNTASDGEIQTLDFDGPLLADDDLFISSVAGDKYVSNRRDGNHIPMLYSMSPYSRWLELRPGVNQFRVFANGLPISYAVRYTRKFGGL